MKKLLISSIILMIFAFTGCSEDSHVEVQLKGENSVDLVVLVDEPNFAISEMASAFAEKLSEYTGKTVKTEELSEFDGNESVYSIYIDTVNKDGSNLPEFNAHMSVKEADTIT